MTILPWKPHEIWTIEDKLLEKYWREVGGIIFTEVIVGRGGVYIWPAGAKPRRIDGVRVVPPGRLHLGPEILPFYGAANIQRFQELVPGAKVEVIEVKRHLNRVVIGQVIVGADLLESEYAPRAIQQVVICEVGDPVLEWVCKKRNIRVWIP